MKRVHHNITVLVKFTLKGIAAHSCIIWTIISQQPNNDSRKAATISLVNETCVGCVYHHITDMQRGRQGSTGPHPEVHTLTQGHKGAAREHRRDVGSWRGTVGHAVISPLSELLNR